MTNDAQIDVKEELKKEFLLHLLRTGKNPVTVYAFCEQMGREESDFYQHYGSFKSLEKDIWKSLFTKVNGILNADENYSQYSSYEKWLSFLYTFIEVLKENRSYVMLRCEHLERKEFRPWFMEGMRAQLKDLCKEIVGGGLETEEIATRPIITDKYHEVLWAQVLYVIRVWINDESEEFQVTDAAIEKTSVLLFELMKKGPIDMLIDFVKFAYQNKAY